MFFCSSQSVGKILTTETIFCLCEVEITRINLNKLKRLSIILDSIPCLFSKQCNYYEVYIDTLMTIPSFLCPTFRRFCLNHEKNQLYKVVSDFSLHYTFKTWNAVAAKMSLIFWSQNHLRSASENFSSDICY